MNKEAPVQSDTIAAISTPSGEGAIALVRLSGEDALAVADQMVRGKEKPSTYVSHFQHLAELVDDGEVIDQAVVAVQRAPRSYTGEDMVEISCHGGILLTARVLGVCLRAGARAARPGEFTERAFLNGKMDLTQAEAVIDMIRATTDLALRAATEQLQGRLGETIRAIRDELIALLAQIEGSLDFPDEDLTPDSRQTLRARLGEVRGKMDSLLATAERGRIMREGVRVVIYGATNAGKSSLLNRLLGYERAIVSDLPGTTRDTIEEVINLRGVPVRLVDSAGLRETNDPLERAGMERTERSRQAADLVLHLSDASAPRPKDFAEEQGVAELLLLNKSDLSEHGDWESSKALRISCLTDGGLAGLDEAILARISAGNLQAENSIAINTRHRDCLRRARESCKHADATFAENHSLEYVALDLRASLAAVTEVIAAESDDAILDSVFSQFCIGK
ncbi:MAG: tRNA uridine-5-carboxymethylaminomethyl(34) synthesis GTPase MnmE [Chthoniobacterales bacterium]